MIVCSRCRLREAHPEAYGLCADCDDEDLGVLVPYVPEDERETEPEQTWQASP